MIIITFSFKLKIEQYFNSKSKSSKASKASLLAINLSSAFNFAINSDPPLSLAYSPIASAILASIPFSSINSFLTSVHSVLKKS